MDLFTPVVPHEQLHPNFVNALVDTRIGERQVIQRWAHGFPDRDGKFVKEFQTTFNSSFWELYLHGLFRDYGFEMNWENAAPDFHLSTPQGHILVEAVTANAALGATREWEKESAMTDNVMNKEFWPLNREAIIRLSNSFWTKAHKYRQSYAELPHVKRRPFVIAVAPFEQPDFQFQYDRPIRALLYDDYVDEDAYHRAPEKFPNGPPSVQLGFVDKNSDVSIEMGAFLNDLCSEVSAVLFSCVATWGKTVAMSDLPAIGWVNTTWGGPRGPYPKRAAIGIPSETVSDGLQVFHNPYARHPLNPMVFRRQGVVQHYLEGGEWTYENLESCLHSRTTFVATPVSESTWRSFGK